MQGGSPEQCEYFVDQFLFSMDFVRDEAEMFYHFWSEVLEPVYKLLSSAGVFGSQNIHLSATTE
jgi:rhamnogalacturonyl hydrolase YesR